MTAKRNDMTSNKQYEQLERYVKNTIYDISKNMEILRKRVITLESRVKELEGNN